MSITKDVENHIMQNASIKDCLRNDIINFSSLSRKIIGELGMKKRDFDAVLIACRRLQKKLKPGSSEKKIAEILGNSRLEMRTGIAVFIIEKDVYFDYLLDIEKEIKKKKGVFHIIEGVNTLTLVTNMEFAGTIRELFRNKIVKENKGLAEVIVKTSTQIEKTPGVVSYLYSLFSGHGINIFETMSAWTDTLFIIDENDLEKAVKLLRFN